MSEPSIDLEDFDKKIVELAEVKIKAGEPALINALGIKLGPTLALVKAQTGMTFQEYLVDRLSDQYDIITVKENTPGLWPKGRAFESAVAAYRERPNRIKPRRYQPWLWKAFADPLGGGSRFYNQTDRQIVDAASAKPGWLEIPGRLIRQADQPASVRDIHNRIDEWFKETGLDPTDFIDAEAERLTSKQSGRTVLDLVLDSLNNRQLQSVTLPLDIIAELAKRRV
ncbi:MAG: hypothetical protein IE912_02560 [Brevundimonas diminuta]|nr:hypothetical protein [Brevundimonas diminuta]MBD3817784.1 hypothetical protein [Brevundimonas diminuta]